ncbi:hypothetical protein Patl1_15644 [Pistacia atlantica]|uniref:Uncharacterized protein n=1 Tax=Pistacia atlantica TaxID=434234 RepID=A0ACC1B5Y0_9ROSI|nr:hypothetical protein Patl1_15644 [Pistacia atlantica]
MVVSSPSQMGSSLFVFSLLLVLASGFHKSPPLVLFDEGYTHLFGNDNLVVHKDGKSVHLTLDESTGREERYNLWFDPSDDFHHYSILWTDSQIIFYVDNIPVREVKRTESMGGDFPSKPMSLYATIWDGSDWATNGGKYRVNYKYAPYITEFSNFILHGCAVDPIEQTSSRCDTNQDSIPTGVTPSQRIKMDNFRRKHMTYSYCYDQIRYKVPPSECVINPLEAERLKAYDPVTFGGGRRRHGKHHHRSHASRSSADAI